MADFNLPESHILIYLQLSKLPNEKIEEIISVLNNYKKSEPYKSVLEQINDIDSDFDDANILGDAVFSLVRTKNTKSYTNEELVGKVKESLEENEDYEEAEITLICDLVMKLLKSINNNDLLISSLGYSAVTANNNIFFSGQIYDELRPVYLNDDLAGLAFYHTFRIHFEQPNGDHSDQYFTLDTSDIESLINTLQKAKIRAEKIKIKYETDLINI